MTQEAYQTVDQECYWGNATNLADIGAVVTGIPVQSQVSTSARPVLGLNYSRLTVTRVDYRPQAPQMLAGDESDALVALPRALFVLVHTDSLKALAMDAVVTGVPEAAAQVGEIISNVNFQPRGPVYRCTAHNIDDVDQQAVTDGNRVFVVATGGSGAIVRGAVNAVAPAGGGIFNLGTQGASVTFPSALQGWVLDGESTGIGG